MSNILPAIYTLRGFKVMLDSDLASLYDIETGVFNQSMRRNAHRFPPDFAFQITREEVTNLRSQIVISSSHGGRRYMPWVFTEHGAIMAATILQSERAVSMSVYVVRAFVRLRSELLANAVLEARLQSIEKTLIAHDTGLRDLVGKIRTLLLSPPEIPPKEMGFHTKMKNP